MKHRAYRWLCAVGFGLAVIAADMTGLALITEAQATVVRTTTYVTTLPKGCVRTKVGGVTLWRCGKTYYQYYKKRYVVVIIN